MQINLKKKHFECAMVWFAQKKSDFIYFYILNVRDAASWPSETQNHSGNMKQIHVECRSIILCYWQKVSCCGSFTFYSDTIFYGIQNSILRTRKNDP